MKKIIFFLCCLVNSLHPIAIGRNTPSHATPGHTGRHHEQHHKEHDHTHGRERDGRHHSDTTYTDYNKPPEKPPAGSTWEHHGNILIYSPAGGWKPQPSLTNGR